jgi:hypothetical protein
MSIKWVGGRRMSENTPTCMGYEPTLENKNCLYFKNCAYKNSQDEVFKEVICKVELFETEEARLKAFENIGEKK